MKAKSNPFDKAARYAAKIDPPPFFAWLLDGSLAFERWLDTRTVTLPDASDRVSDTAAEFSRGRNMPVAGIVEVLSRARVDDLERFAEYVIRYRRELRHGRNRRGRYQAICIAISLTGRLKGRALNLSVPELPGGRFTFQPVAIDLIGYSAETVLRQIERGKVGRCVLPWIPLMSGGGEEGIIKLWKRLARRETNTRRRSDYAALTLVFAELARCHGAWRNALKGWNMMQSQQVLEWMEEGREEGERAGKQDDLLRVLDLRFTNVPKKFIKQVQATNDIDTLNAWIDTAVTAPDWKAFAKSINGSR